MTDLVAEISQQQVELLNSSDDAGNIVKQGYRDDPALLVGSECDAEMLLHIPFNGRISRLTSLRISSPPGCGPRTVKLFVNSPKLDFDAASMAQPAHTLDLQEEQLCHSDAKETIVSLPVVRFRNVHTLSLLVETNQTDDSESTTMISRVQVFGHVGDSFDVASIKDVSKQDQE